MAKKQILTEIKEFSRENIIRDMYALLREPQHTKWFIDAIKGDYEDHEMDCECDDMCVCSIRILTATYIWRFYDDHLRDKYGYHATDQFDDNFSEFSEDLLDILEGRAEKISAILDAITDDITKRLEIKIDWSLPNITADEVSEVNEEAE